MIKQCPIIKKGKEIEKGKHFTEKERKKWWQWSIDVSNVLKIAFVLRYFAFNKPMLTIFNFTSEI